MACMSGSQCDVTLTLMQALELLMTISCCKTAALPAMSSCTPMCPIVLHATFHTSKDMIEMDCAVSAASIKHCRQRTIPYRDVSLLIELEHAIHGCCGSGHLRISSMIQVMHSMTAVAVVATGPAQ